MKRDKRTFLHGRQRHGISQRKLGIVYEPADDKGDVGVQIQKKKMRINYKRLQLKVAAAEMQNSADYDFSIILIPWKTGRPRHQMDRKFVPGLEIRYEKEEGRKIVPYISQQASPSVGREACLLYSFCTGREIHPPVLVSAPKLKAGASFGA